MTVESTGYHPVIKYGYNNDIDTTSTPETVWAFGGRYVWPTSVGQVSIVSSSANDTAAGTGARTLHIEGVRKVSGEYIEATEDITLNGASSVTSTLSDWWRVHRAFVSSVGSGGFNDGNITVTLDSKTVAYVGLDSDTSEGNGQTLLGLYTVPQMDEHTCYFTGFFVKAGKQGAVDAKIVINRRKPDNAWRAHRKFDTHSRGGTLDINFDRKHWLKVDPGEDWEVLVVGVSSDNVGVSCELRFCFEKNKHKSPIASWRNR